MKALADSKDQWILRHGACKEKSLAGERTKDEALASYAEFADAHRWKFEWMWLNQRAVRHLHGRPLDWLAHFTSRPRVTHFLFRKYLNLAPPSFALPAPPQAQPALTLAA